MKTMNINILGRLCLATFAILVCFSVAADTGTAKQINDIKRSGTCFHAESTAATRNEATDAATQLLAFYINEYIKDNGLSHPAVTADNIPGIRYIDLNRGTNIRVFAYADRSAVLGDEAPAPVAQNHQQEEIYDSPQIAQEVTEVPEEVAEVAIDDTVYGSNDNSYGSYDSNDDSDFNTDDSNLSPLMRTYLGALDECVNGGDLSKVMSILGRFQAERVVKRFGPANKCRNKTWAYWMIYDPSGKNLEAFLSPGSEGQRVNLISGAEDDSLTNYNGANNLALWFEFW